LVVATPKVLIVDDSAADRELIAAMLQPAFETLEAVNVEAGLDAFRREHPDCVLLDHHMPGSAGIDGLIDFVRARAVVVMVSGSDSEALAAEAIKRGAHDFIRKDRLTKPNLLRTITRERERRLLENALAATQQRFDEVAARIQEVLWVRSLDGEFLYLSSAFERIWGRPRTGMTLADWESHVHPEDRGLSKIANESVAAGREYELEYRIVRPGGGIRRVRSRGYPIFEDGVLTRYGGITRDISDETQLHQELRLAQKLEAIGQLAAGMAHEINTPAQYVSDNVAFLTQGFRDLLPLLDSCRELLRRERVAAEVQALRDAAASADLEYLAAELPAALEQTAAGIGQIAKIVKAMKEFAHPADDIREVNLNQTIETTVTVAKNEWKYVAEVTLDLAPNLALIACNPSEINQVLLNLIVNAAHAIESAVGPESDDKGEIRIRTTGDDDFVEISILDNGCGIPEAIRDRIYDPFFTTKEVGKGTGQGLAISHRIITQRHGGTIRCESTVGEGTEFIIRLPIGMSSEGRRASDQAANGDVHG
jgi:PAS domain S-box-containing protein